MTAYLLPCSCGLKTIVEPRQAGETIECPCGASLAVPSMLKMASLEPAEPESDAKKERGPWGVGQALVLLGAVLILLGGVPAVWMFANEPPSPRRELSPEEIRDGLATLTPVQCWQLYRDLRERGVKRQELPPETAHAKYLLRRRMYAGSLALVGCVGIGLIVAAAVAVRSRRE